MRLESHFQAPSFMVYETWEFSSLCKNISVQGLAGQQRAVLGPGSWKLHCCCFSLPLGYSAGQAASRQGTEPGMDSFQLHLCCSWEVGRSRSMVDGISCCLVLAQFPTGWMLCLCPGWDLGAWRSSGDIGAASSCLAAAWAQATSPSLHPHCCWHAEEGTWTAQNWGWIDLSSSLWRLPAPALVNNSGI